MGLSKFQPPNFKTVAVVWQERTFLPLHYICIDDYAKLTTSLLVL